MQTVREFVRHLESLADENTQILLFDGREVTAVLSEDGMVYVDSE